ncbi:MAG: TIGR02466 family protein [Paracoccaceae bacterium]
MSTRDLFATRLYRAALNGGVSMAELEATCQSIAEDDEAGQDWCEANHFPGYTSYASLTDLAWRFDAFAAVQRALDAHVAAFAEACAFDLGDRPLVLDSLWVNVLPEGGSHSGHIHPHSVVSGTLYVAMPAGTSAIRFEDPRLAMMMAAPGRRADAAEALRPFVYVAPDAGDVVLWESWLRHEVPVNWAEEDRVTVSFNYRWGEAPA